MKYKRRCILALLSALTLAFTSVPVTAVPVWAEDTETTAETAATSGTCGTSLTWSYDTESKTLTIEGTGAMTNWYYTSSIPWYDFSGEISAVALPDGLTSIGPAAFYNCTALTAVSIPDGVTSIGSMAFYGCSALTDLHIPDSVSAVGGDAFSNTPWLTAKRTENPLVIINNLLIDGTACSGDVTIPQGVTSIGDDAFYFCSELTGITIPDSVTSIGGYAFSYCSGLEEIMIPEGVAGIGDSAFNRCTALASVSIPSTLQAVGNYAFDGCSALTEITIPESVTGIGGYAFRGCTALTSVTIRNPYCQIYDAEGTIPATAVICSYPDSFAQKYAEKYGITFTALEGDPPVLYTYEIVPLLSPFNNYFYIKTNNPDPASFRFADKSSVYSEEAVMEASTVQYADVVYEDTETLRVNGGYLFYSGSTDGGELTLQMLNLNDTWEDMGQTITLPALCDEVDYLIDSYATEEDFFSNMDAVQTGFASICLYSGSYIRGELYRSADYWSVSTSPHIDQHFYLYSPYSRRDNGSLLASAVYPFRYDSLGFPSIMARTALRLDSTATYAWSETSHAFIDVTYNGETRSYGGQGHGEGQGLTVDKLTRFFTFEDSEEVITLDSMRQLLDAYSAVEMDDDVPRDDALTWEQITETAGDGAWTLLKGGYAYLYKANDNNSFTTDEFGAGHSLYWWGSLGYGCDVWIDGRYINSYEKYVPGAALEDYPESDIILFDIPVPSVTYDSQSVYNSEMDTYETVYSNVEVTETVQQVRYVYNSTEGIWIASAVNSSTYNTIKAMTEQGALDEKYLDVLQLTYDEAVELQVDRNSDFSPMHYYIYNGTAEPGTEVRRGDVNDDGTMQMVDLIQFQKWLIGIPDTELPNPLAAEFSGDSQLNSYDLALMKKALLRE